MLPNNAKPIYVGRNIPADAEYVGEGHPQPQQHYTQPAFVPLQPAPVQAAPVYQEPTLPVQQVQAAPAVQVAEPTKPQPHAAVIGVTVEKEVHITLNVTWDWLGAALRYAFMTVSGHIYATERKPTLTDTGWEVTDGAYMLLDTVVGEDVQYWRESLTVRPGMTQTVVEQETLPEEQDRGITIAPKAHAYGTESRSTGTADYASMSKTARRRLRREYRERGEQLPQGL